MEGILGLGEIAHLASLRDGDLLRREGLFVVESRATLVRALRRCPELLRGAAVNPAAGAYLRSKVEGWDWARGLIIELEDAQLEEVVGYHVHQGAVAVFRRPPVLSLADFLVHQGEGPLLVLNRIADPDNVGSIFRSALAFGAVGVVCTKGTADPLYRKAIRTSMGATLVVPHTQVVDSEPRAWVGALATAGWKLVGLTADPTASSLESLASGRWAMVLGNEGDGIDSDLAACIDQWATIPMSGAVDSLNVAHSASIALYAAFIRRRKE